MSSPRQVANPLVVALGESAPRDLMGAKAFRLAELTEAGLPVPRGFVITTVAADSVLAPVWPSIDDIVREARAADSPAARDAAKRIEALVCDAAWPIDFQHAVRTSLAVFGSGRRFAVRSSSVGEDGAAHSFAGQLDSFLGIPPDEIVGAVRRCWASAYSERALLYRNSRGLCNDRVRIAVIIQEMVESRVSGVAFTADPLTGAPKHVVVAGYGLGVGVVSDVVETDTYVRDGTGPWQSTVRSKTRRMLSSSNGTGGTGVADVDPADRELPALSREQLESLSATLLQIEAMERVPQDVEWAFDDTGFLHVLQARPISPLPRGELAVWDDGNIGESYPGLTLPLTYSFVRHTYEALFGGALREAGVPPRDIAVLRPALRYLIGVIRGRLYMNVVNYYRLFAAVPGIRHTVRKWETALGVAESIESATVLGASRSLRARWPALVRTYARLVCRFLYLRKEVERFRRGVDEFVARFENADFASQSFDDLWQTYESIQDDLLASWTVLIYNDFFAFLLHDRLSRLCDDDEDLHHRLLRGLANTESLGPVRSMLGLIAAARAVPAVVRLVTGERPAREVWDELTHLPSAAPFRAAVDEHLRRYGQRTMEELKLEAKPLDETPWVIVSMLRNFWDLDTEAQPPGRAKADEAAARQFSARFRGRPVQRLYARWILARTRRLVSDRENMSYARCRAYGVLRQLFHAMGHAAQNMGALKNADDVFLLTVEDLENYARGGLVEGDLGTLVEGRKRQYRGFARHALPHRMSCRGPVYSHHFSTADATDIPNDALTLRGTPCSPGLIRGIAKVVPTPSVDTRVEGDILVAPATEPAWMFLLLKAKGLVVERGSVLSHAAIIGRELGIPTVMGVAGATTRIVTGDEIELNGATGQIRILRRSDGSRTAW